MGIMNPLLTCEGCHKKKEDVRYRWCDPDYAGHFCDACYGMDVEEPAEEPVPDVATVDDGRPVTEYERA